MEEKFLTAKCPVSYSVAVDQRAGRVTIRFALLDMERLATYDAARDAVASAMWTAGQELLAGWETWRKQREAEEL